MTGVKIFMKFVKVREVEKHFKKLSRVHEFQKSYLKKIHAFEEKKKQGKIKNKRI